MAAESTACRGIPLGFMPINIGGGIGTFALDAANDRLALSFIARSDGPTLEEAACYVSAVAGTVTAAQFQAILMADSAGSPDNVAIQTVVCDQTPTANAIHTFSLLNSALTGGNRYWIVFKNTNGTPASNNLTIRFGAQDSGVMPSSNSPINGWAKRQSTDASTWAATALANVFGLRVKYNDGSFDGLPFHNTAVSGTTDGVYSAREVGSRFVTPAGVRYRVIGIRHTVVTRTGTPTGSLRYRLYLDTALLATTGLLYTTNPTVGFHDLFFSSVQLLPPNAIVRVVQGETTQSDTSSNRYNTRVFSIFDDADSKALMPFGGTMMKTYWNGSSWADTDSEIVPCALLLDADDPFEVSVGGGGVVFGGG